MIAKTGMEFHWSGYQYMGPGTHLEKRLKRGDPGINRLDRVSKQHDIDYSKARSLDDKHKADEKMTRSIDKFKKKIHQESHANQENVKSLSLLIP